MTEIIIAIELALLGLVIGSFCGASVWRLRARQLAEDKQLGEEIDAKEYKQLKGLLHKTVGDDRSMCLHCHHQLQWYDLLPLISWLMLKGRCRYCRKPIGVMEPIIELGTAFFFVASYLLWPDPLSSWIVLIEFILWLIIGSGLIILFVYDLRWFLLPDKIMFPMIALAMCLAALRIWQSEDVVFAVVNLVGSIAILSGIYYALYLYSRGQWIGFGDIKLGLVLAGVLGEWPLAFLTLLIANVIGCLVVLPGLLSGKLHRTSHVPFGPMLILACFIVGLVGTTMIAWYLGLAAL